MYDLLLHWFGFGLCHQLPERSLFGGGVQAPVCARDTGIYAGVLLSLLLLSALQRRPAGLPSWGRAVMLAGFVALMALDGITSYAGIRETTNAVRLATGLLCGYAIGALLTPLLNDQLWRTSSNVRVLGDARTLVIWLISLPVAFAVLFFGGVLLGGLYPLLIVLTVVGALGAVNVVIVTLFPAFERRADRLLDAWRPLLLAFGLVWVEIAASAALKLWLDSLLA